MNKAIDLQEKCLEVRPPGHQYHGDSLNNLACSLWERYKSMNTHSDLLRANKLYKEALGTYSVQHPYFASVVAKLGETILLLSDISQSFSPDTLLPSVDEAFQTYQLLKRCSLAVFGKVIG